MHLGARTPYRNPACGIWHVGQVVGVRRPPSATDARTFTRLEFPDTCGAGDVEVITVVLTLARRAAIVAPRFRCAGCWSDGMAQDTSLSPDTAGAIDNWRDALERQGESVWFCPSCRSHAASLTAMCMNCGGGPLVPAPSRNLKGDDEAVTVVP